MDPAGPSARAIATLWWVMLAGATAIFLFVMGLLVAAFRGGGAGDEARHERLFLAKLGLAFPVVVLAALLAYGLVIGERFLPRPADDAVSVRAEASQWQWRFGYGDSDRVTVGTLHIPAGRPVDVAISTTDVIHAFWVPRLAGKLDAIPGRVNTLRIEADAPGTYAGRSAEYSGVGYLGHTFTVIAHDAAGWQNFLDGETP
ncbi:cytochrome c oxidase subunit II [Acuticoccus kandeliae]|uniref:cytochrome c oxidase subunit II n=1 Tax=Acuticoccus kandeliae TaxID=2073160 RepID=UPI001FE718D3|nr:cytochrome B [Acuticoccus kandeliae]